MTHRRTRAALLRAASPVAFAALLPMSAVAQDVDPGLCEAIAGSSANANALSNVLRRADDPVAALIACAPGYDASTLNAVIAAYEAEGDPAAVNELRAIVADLTDSPADPGELAATTQSVEEIVDPENEAGEGATAEEGVVAEGTATEEVQPETIVVGEDGSTTTETGIDAVGVEGASEAEVVDATGDAEAEAPAEETVVAETPADEPAADATVVTEAPAEEAATPDVVAEVPAEAAGEEETQALADALAAADAEATAEAPADAPADAEVTADATAEPAPAEEAVVTAGTPAAGAEAPMDAEVTAAVDAAGGDVASGIEAPQQDTEASAEAANAAPVASAAAAAADAATESADATVEADAGSEVATETVTAETAPSATRERDDDDDTFRNALLLGLGAVAVGTLLANQGEVVQETGDRVVVRRDSGDLVVLKNDDALLRQPGSQIETRTYDDGSTLTTVIREDGSRVITVRAANGQVLRRSVILSDGTETVLFDDTQDVAPVQVSELEATASSASRDIEVLTLQDALAADVNVDRRYSLQQIRQIRAVRFLAPELNLSDVNFETGSAVIRPEEAEDLRDIGVAMRNAILDNPGEVFLIEGHTDAVGGAAMNLALSDRRAEAVALALTEFFGVPPENMIVQGYGESNLKVVTGGSERANRRAAVRRITPLLRGEA